MCSALKYSSYPLVKKFSAKKKRRNLHPTANVTLFKMFIYFERQRERERERENLKQAPLHQYRAPSGA